MSSLFKEGVFAADRTIEQDVVVGPWGTNHAVVRFLRSSDFALTALYDNISRSEKAANVAANPIALNGLTFCNNLQAKPRWQAALNCGECEKCIRTKAMFVVETGVIPNVFVDMSLDFDRLSVKSLIETAFFVDLYRRRRSIQ